MEQDQAILELTSKVDALTANIEILTDYVVEQRRRQREWDELKDDLVPIANEMYVAAVEELSEVEPYVQLEDILHLLKRLVRNISNIERMLDQLESLSDLMQDLGPIFNDAFLFAVSQLDEMEGKGYFDVIREGAYVMDNIVDTFGPEDIHQLGDNVVTILTTVKEMTQPEVMGAVQNLTQTMREVEEHPEQIDTSTFGLLKQLREPEVKRGLAVALQMLKSVGENPTADSGSQTTS